MCALFVRYSLLALVQIGNIAHKNEAKPLRTTVQKGSTSLFFTLRGGVDYISASTFHTKALRPCN